MTDVLLKTSVVKGNVKLGKKGTWNVNLPPDVICRILNMPCWREGCCYNAKAWRLYPSVRKSWMNNWNHYTNSPVQFFDDIILKIKNARKPPKWFRWQAAGEIPDQRYFDGMKRVAKIFPEIRFLSFTKRYDLSLIRIPSNLQVVISAWPEMEIPAKLRRRFPVAWMRDGREIRRPRRLAKCTGHCPTCRACWSLSRTKRDVAFDRH